MQTSNLFIKKGSVMVYRLFDIADEINLKKAQTILDQGPENVRRYKLQKDPLRTVTFRDAPLTLSEGEETLSLKIKNEDKKLKYTLEIKIWNYGTISLCYNLVLPEDTNWKDLVYLGQVLEADSVIEELASKKKDEIFSKIKESLKNPSIHPIFEDYTTYLVEELEEQGKPKETRKSRKDKDVKEETAEEKAAAALVRTPMKDPLELLKKNCVAELLLAEPTQTLSDSTRKSIQSSYSQYTNKDLLILDWNTALVVDFTSTKEYKDYVDLIEFSLSQLLKLRIYDQLLDEKLDALYDSMEEKKFQKETKFYENMSEEAGELFLEFSDFFEKLDNSIKTIGDVYLAKVLRSTDKKFGFDELKKSITRKTNGVREISIMCQDKVDHHVDVQNIKKSHKIEWIVVGLISLEIFINFDHLIDQFTKLGVFISKLF